MTALPDGAATRCSSVAVLIDLMSGHWMAQTVAVAARLRIADHIGDGLGDPDGIAATLGLHPPSVRRLFNTLVGLGVLARDHEHYYLTEMGQYFAFRRSGFSAWIRRDAGERVALEDMVGPRTLLFAPVNRHSTTFTRCRYLSGSHATRPRKRFSTPR
jgi:hypothetical protein